MSDLMEYFKPNIRRAKNAMILIWIVLAIEIVALVSGYLQYDLLQKALGGVEITTEAASANDTREQLIGIIYLIAFIISGITFILWFRRAYFNLHQKVPHLNYQEGWAAGAWFVPFLNLFRPYQIMNELFKETRNLLESEYEESPSNRYLGIWWGLWILSNLLGQFVFRYSMRADTIEQLNTVTIVSMIGNLIGIPLALITINVIKTYSEIEPLIPHFPESTIDSIGFHPSVN